MFSFFKKETHSELEQILTRLHLNASNNYRDATKEDLEELKERYAELLDAGKLNEKQIEHYRIKITEYTGKLQNFSHKTQNVGKYSEKI
jgi:chromosome segregation ATPase